MVEIPIDERRSFLSTTLVALNCINIPWMSSTMDCLTNARIPCFSIQSVPPIHVAFLACWPLAKASLNPRAAQNQHE